MIAMMLIVSTRGGYRGRDNRIEDDTIVCTPCTCSLSERAGRCPSLRTPCTCSFANCAHIAAASPLVLASPPHGSVPRLCLAPPASCHLAVISTSLLSCRLPPELPECPDCGVMLRKGVAREREREGENVGLH